MWIWCFQACIWASRLLCKLCFQVLDTGLRAVLMCPYCAMETFWLRSAAWPVSRLQSDSAWTWITARLSFWLPAALQSPSTWVVSACWPESEWFVCEWKGGLGSKLSQSPGLVCWLDIPHLEPVLIKANWVFSGFICVPSSKQGGWVLSVGVWRGRTISLLLALA